MSLLTIELPQLNINGQYVNQQPLGLFVQYIVATVDGIVIAVYDGAGRWQRQEAQPRGQSHTPRNTICVPLDPLTALAQGLVTAEEVGLPGGVEGLIALMKK